MLCEENKTLVSNVSLSDYTAFLSFAKANPSLTYESFDSHTMKDLSLFAVREDIDFSAIEGFADRIIRELPAIKRVFSAPVIRLKDGSEILPVEAVKIINNRTVVHALSHSELWESVSEGSVRPKKLMTLQHEDQYEIYENLIFAKMIGIVLHHVRKNVCILTELLYSNREMKFDLLERVNHLSHYIAMAKLHTGYIREYDKYRAPAERCLDKLFFLERIIESRLGSTVYKKCKSKHKNLTLKKTNIFRMHKDYHRVYLLMKYLIEQKLDDGELDQNEDVTKEKTDAYGAFCAMMLVFSVGHFNFDFKDSTFDFTDLKAHAEFLSWTLDIEKLEIDGKYAFSLTFFKDKEYKVLLVCENGGASEIGNASDFDELLYMSFDTDDKRMHVSLYDIDSFRRIQRVLLRGMVMSDTARDTCAFCGKPLERTEFNGSVSYECDSCRMQIRSLICPETNKKYTASFIKHYTVAREEQTSDDILLKKRAEALMHFRNITEIDENGSVICPICNKNHVKKD